MAEEVSSGKTDTIGQVTRMYNQYNLLQIRLDVSEIIGQAQTYLEGIVRVPAKDESGFFIEKTIYRGKAKANPRGVAEIMSWLTNTINAQVVQGNFPMDKTGKSIMYDQFIEEFQLNFMDVIMINLHEYGINEDEAMGIVDNIMNLVKPFMTRLIGNKERQSYGETFREVSSSTVGGGSHIPLFGKK